MYSYFILATLNGQLLFEMEAIEVGPLLYGQAKLVFFIQIGVFGYSFYGFVKKNIACNLLMNINLIGIFLMLVHTSLLGNLMDIALWIHNFFEITWIVVVIGVVGMLVQYVIEKRDFLKSGKNDL